METTSAEFWQLRQLQLFVVVYTFPITLVDKNSCHAIAIHSVFVNYEYGLQKILFFWQFQTQHITFVIAAMPKGIEQTIVLIFLKMTLCDL